MAKILCLEGEKSASPYGARSVRDMLEFMERSSGIGFDYYSVGTRDELERRLSDFSRVKSYSLLYLGFRSTPGQIELLRDAYSLNDLAQASAGKWEGRILHLGCSRLLKVTPGQMATLKKTTRVSLLSGYTGTTDYFPAALLEMSYLELLNTFRTPAAIARHLGEQQRFLIKKLGFKLI